MVMSRSPRNLPGTDPFLLQKILVAILLCLVVVILALNIATAADIGAQGGHLPWPIAQWGLTTPLGTLAVAVVGGLVCGLPFLLVLLARPMVVRPVDMTELPLAAWPRPLPPWRAPGDRTLVDTWLGHSWPQRALSLLALALAALLLVGLLAALVASGWYGFTHIPDCGASGCPPVFGQLTSLPECVGFAVMFLGQFAWIAQVERRCGVWFRARAIVESGLGTYIRRPGVTPEAADAALQRYTRGARPPIPMAQVLFVAVLALAPALLVISGGELLSVWLSTQWIPT